MIPILEKKNHLDHSILAVGSLAFDSIQAPAGRVERVLGGSANYFSISASFFTSLKLVGVVGEDFPTEHLQLLEKRGIDLRGISIVPGKTFHWVGQYGQDLNEAQTLETHLNVFEHFSPKLPADYSECRYVFLANIDPDLQQQVWSTLKKPQLIAADSMNYWIHQKKPSLLRILEKVDLLIINETEALLLSERSNIVEAAEWIRNGGPKILIVKRGEYGALLFTNHGIFSAPALPLPDVKDPTGAGDTFAGGVMGYLSHEKISLEQLQADDAIIRKAVIFGSVMASFTVQDFGLTALLKASPSQIEARYKDFLKMTQF